MRAEAERFYQQQGQQGPEGTAGARPQVGGCAAADLVLSTAPQVSMLTAEAGKRARVSLLVMDGPRGGLLALELP
jgi:hypothetical protein